MSLIVSEKYGVNPSMSQCFYCGECKEIILFGKLKGDKEAPRSVVMDLEPCDKCKEKVGDGILLLEATGVSPQEPKPTGRYLALKKEAYDRLFDIKAKKGIAFVDVELFEKLMEGYNDRE
jgi:hypothetical protein